MNHGNSIKDSKQNMVPPAGIEPAAPGLGNSSGNNPSDPSKNQE
jgi:hypothetical protein